MLVCSDFSASKKLRMYIRLQMGVDSFYQLDLLF